MINFEDYFGDLTEEEYVKQTEEHFEWLKNNALSKEAIDKFNECTPGYILKTDEINALLAKSKENHAFMEN